MQTSKAMHSFKLFNSTRPFAKTSFNQIPTPPFLLLLGLSAQTDLPVYN